MALVVGALLQDSRYQIHTILGSTDVDVTYEAVHTYLDRTVILKQLRSDVNWSVESQPPSHTLMARLSQFVQCQHPCLGKVLDCFEDNEQLYLILPTYSDPTLEQWLQSSDSIQPSTIRKALRPLVDSLEKLHEKGLVHGTLTPQSLRYRVQTNEIIIADIGWQTLLMDLLGDRHQVNHTPAADIRGLARIVHHLLGEETLSTVPSIQEFLAETLESTSIQTRSANAWLDQLEQHFTSDQMTSIETIPIQKDDLSQDQQRDNSQSSSESSSPKESELASQKTTATKSTSSHKRRRWLPALLGVTAIFAAVSGGTVGYFFRSQDATQLDQTPLFGSEIFGSDQDFPPSEYWPGLKTKDYGTSVLFERLPTQRVANPPAPNEVGVVPWGQVNEQAPSPQFIPYQERRQRVQAPNPTGIPANENYPIEEPLGNPSPSENDNIVEIEQGSGDRPYSSSPESPSSPSGSEQRESTPAPNPAGGAVTESPASNQPPSDQPAAPSPVTPYVTEMPPAIDPPSTSTNSSPPPSVNHIPAPAPILAPLPTPAPLITPVSPTAV